eukprot:GHRR01012996.1.p1 GENE.GHRR01012996.1~~GHRR01012996.1.p1  ORF type:complete len:155 (+),score=22.57 GHRR01012996.1:604-1068(+)
MLASSVVQLDTLLQDPLCSLIFNPIAVRDGYPCCHAYCPARDGLDLAVGIANGEGGQLTQFKPFAAAYSSHVTDGVDVFVQLHISILLHLSTAVSKPYFTAHQTWTYHCITCTGQQQQWHKRLQWRWDACCCPQGIFQTCHSCAMLLVLLLQSY